MFYDPQRHDRVFSEVRVLGRDVVDVQPIDAGNRLRVICMHGVGLDGIDVDAAKRKGIVVTNLPGGNADSVAELAVGMMFCLARGVLAADKATRAGTRGDVWEPR